MSRSETGPEQAPISVSPDVIERLEDIFSSLNTGDAPGLNVGVMHKGRVLFRRGYGLASAELGVVNQPATRMRIGSTSKQFTCLAVMLLNEEQKIDIDEDIRSVLPELKIEGDALSARQLMQHTGGLRCHLDLWTLLTGMTGRFPDEEPFNLMCRLRSRNFRPGEDFIYCNGGYVLLAEMVARVSQVPFGSFLRERIFAPLGMVDTELLGRDGDIVPRNAHLHVRTSSGGWRRGHMLLPLGGEGGLISTVDDMLLWLRHMDRPIVGSSATWAAMMSRTHLCSGGVSDYGLGLIMRDYRGVSTIGHAGAVLGGLSEMVKVPAHRLDISILANRSDVKVADLAKKIIDVVLEKELGPKSLPPARFAPFDGLYRQPRTGQVIRLATEQDIPIVDFGSAKASLLHRDDEAVVFSGALGEMEFRRVGHELQSDGLDVMDCGVVQRFERLADSGVSGDTGPLVAHYHNDEVPASADIRCEGDAVYLLLRTHFGRVSYLLRKLGDDLWRATYADGSSPAWFAVEIEREQAEIVAISLSSMRTRRLRFVRAGFQLSTAPIGAGMRH